MKRRPALILALLLLAALGASCAVQDGAGQLGSTAYAPPPQPAARIGLPPPYRPFFDELEDYGDWVSIEPYGWVFRPRVNFVAWRPYEDGWWEPSDYYGWIWNSNEPFGWITYHYGDWFYDGYQGWVWQPGPVWGPAWVAWVAADDYVGWAPLAPAQYTDFEGVPDGLFTYVGAQQFTSRDMSQRALFVSRLPAAPKRVSEILNIGHVNGVPFNRGPDPVALASMGTSIPEAVDAAKLPRVRLNASSAHLSDADLMTRTRRLVAAGTRELTASKAAGVAPPPPAEPRRKPDARPVAPDSTGTDKPAPADSTESRVDAKRHARPGPGVPRDSTRVR